MIAFQAMRCSMMIGVLHWLLLFSFPGRVAAQEVPSQKPLVSEWRLVARASHIFHGKLIPTAPLFPVATSHQVGSPDQFFTWRLEKITTLKGPLPPSANAEFYTSRSTASKLVERVTALFGAEVIVLVRKTDYSSKSLYLTFSDDPQAIQPASGQRVESLRKELRNQERIVAGFPRSVAAKPDRYHIQVKRCISDLLKAETAQPAIDELSRMGAKAIPSLIRLMDDRRPLANRMLGFPNSPRAPNAPPTGSPADFESHYHFGGELVVDAIANVLKMITDEKINFLRSGSTEEQRKAVVRGRIYLYYTYPDTGYANKKASPMTTVNPVQ